MRTTTDKLMTTKQAEKAERNQHIVSAYLDLGKQFPDSSRNMKMSKIAESVKMSVMGVKKILIQKGVY